MGSHGNSLRRGIENPVNRSVVHKTERRFCRAKPSFRLPKFQNQLFTHQLTMNKQIVCVIGICALLIAVVGCEQPKPEGLPPLQKTTLVLQQDGSPLVGASVSLYSEDKSIKWSVGGVSNNAGEVSVKTHGQYLGAPLGKYVVLVTKQEFTKSSLPETAPLDAAEYAEWQRQRDAEVLPVYDLVDPKFGNPKTSPLKIDISKGAKSETFDCGKAIRQVRK